MKHRVTVAVSATSLLLSLGIGLAGPASAEPAPSTTTTTTYSMPSVTGVTLDKAISSITALSSTTEFQLTPYVKGGEPVHVLSPGSWLVCSQTPSAGSKINAKSRLRVTIERPWYGC